MYAALIAQLFTQYHLTLEDAETEQFDTLLAVFLETNAQVNLSAIREPQAIIEKHFVDSVLLAALGEELRGPLLDL